MTHYYETETPCETCCEGGGCGYKHTVRVTEYNTSCMTRIQKFIGGQQTYDMTLTWDEADALADLLAQAGHDSKPLKFSTL